MLRRLPRVRFTIRCLMATVAVAGMTLGAHRCSVRRAEFRGRAARHAELIELVSELLANGVECEFSGCSVYSKPMPSASRARLDRVLVAEKHLVAKYKRVARYPWLSVEPDPPAAE